MGKGTARLPWVMWYPTDWLGDAKLHRAPLETRGAWQEILQHMFHDQVHTLKLPMKEWARLLGCHVATAARVLRDIKRREIGTVSGAISGRCSGRVAVTCRRLEKHANKKEYNRIRQRRLRGRDVVTPS